MAECTIPEAGTYTVRAHANGVIKVLVNGEASDDRTTETTLSTPNPVNVHLTLAAGDRISTDPADAHLVVHRYGVTGEALHDSSVG